jgi:tetratricopeptide (TPR) repeat protein
MELPPDLYQKITELSEEGNQLLEGHFSDRAVRKWTQALSLLPDPKSDWEASTWLYTSIGDARYQDGEFASASDAFFDALNCPDGQSNPFVHYRLGQCQIRLGNEKAGVDHLLQAYMLDGEAIFNSETGGNEFLSILKQEKLV